MIFDVDVVVVGVGHRRRPHPGDPRRPGPLVRNPRPHAGAARPLITDES
jgi:hypothetical protein